MWSWQKSLEFLSGREVSLDDNFPKLKKLCQPCFHEIKNIYELMKKGLSSQELSLAETKVKELAVLRTPLNG